MFKSKMQVFRETCESLKRRESGISVVCAKIIQLDPFIVADSTGQASFEMKKEFKFSINDCAYFLLEFKDGKPYCRRMTIVPEDIFPVAYYQIKAFNTATKK